MAQTVETNMEYQMFKGLQRPLEFLGLQGRYITWAAITAGVGMIMVKQRRGLYSKKTDKGIFIYAYSERL